MNDIEFTYFEKFGRYYKTSCGKTGDGTLAFNKFCKNKVERVGCLQCILGISIDGGKDGSTKLKASSGTFLYLGSEHDI